MSSFRRCRCCCSSLFMIVEAASLPRPRPGFHPKTPPIVSSPGPRTPATSTTSTSPSTRSTRTSTESCRRCSTRERTGCSCFLIGCAQLPWRRVFSARGLQRVGAGSNRAGVENAHGDEVRYGNTTRAVTSAWRWRRRMPFQRILLLHGAKPCSLQPRICARQLVHAVPRVAVARPR